MTTPEPSFDYLAAIDQLRKQKRPDRKTVQEPETLPPPPDESVDYLAVSKAWEAERERKRKGTVKKKTQS